MNFSVCQSRQGGGGGGGDVPPVKLEDRRSRVYIAMECCHHQSEKHVVFLEMPCLLLQSTCLTDPAQCVSGKVPAATVWRSFGTKVRSWRLHRMK